MKIIKSPEKMLFDWKELYRYKDLLYFLSKREITILYKQTILGFSWAIIRPFFSMIIFSLIFGNLASILSDGIPYPIFSYVALVPWTYFSIAMTKSTQSLVSTTNIFTKVYFPRLIIPITPLLSGLVDFLIALSFVGVLMIYFSITPSINIVWLPLLVFIMILFASGVGIFFSALSIQYRDIRHGMQFLSQLLMYAAPVVWPISLVSEKFGEDVSFWYGLYPMVGVIEGFRSSLIGTTPMPYNHILIGLISSSFIFLMAVVYFLKERKKFCRCCLA